MPRIQARDFDARVDRHFDLKFTRRRAGGWLVIRRDTGHLLGWLYQEHESGQWHARTGGDPFVPTGMDILDKIRAQDAFAYESRQTGAGTYGMVASDAQRGEAAIGLVEYLLRARALAVQAVDVAATRAALAAHEADAADYREAASAPGRLADAARSMMERAAELAEADAAELRAQLTPAGVS